MKENSTKKTMGRRKIEIKPIQNKTSLQVTFTKRRGGVFKKASELSVLCGADVAIIVQSPANKVYSFGNPDVESVIHRFETGSSANSRGKSGYAEAVRRLEEDKKRIKELHEPEGMHWWDESVEGMELCELEGYFAALEDLRGRVLKRAEEIGKSKVGDGLDFDESGSSLLGFQDPKLCDGLDFDESGLNFLGFEDPAIMEEIWQALSSEEDFYHAGETSSRMFEDAGCSSSNF